MVPSSSATFLLPYSFLPTACTPVLLLTTYYIFSVFFIRVTTIWSFLVWLLSCLLSAAPLDGRMKDCRGLVSLCLLQDREWLLAHGQHITSMCRLHNWNSQCRLCALWILYVEEAPLFALALIISHCDFLGAHLVMSLNFAILVLLAFALVHSKHSPPLTLSSLVIEHYKGWTKTCSSKHLEAASHLQSVLVNGCYMSSQEIAAKCGAWQLTPFLEYFLPWMMWL